MSTTVTLAPPARPRSAGGAGGWLRDVWVMTRRNLLHIRREPAQLSDVTIQPVLFTLLFVYVFGAAMTLPGGASYKEFAIPGLLVMNLTMATVGTAIGLSMDLSTGVIDRLRTLPMFQTAILTGRSVSDLLAAGLGGLVVLVTGLAIGWRPDATALSVAAGLGVAVLFAYAFTWVNTCIALAVKGPEAAQGVVFIALFPLTFVSNVFAPTQGMPAWLATVANWNPVSAVASACRVLFGAANPSASVQVWPMQHPIEAALLWSAALLAVCIPLAGHLYRRRTRA